MVTTGDTGAAVAVSAHAPVALPPSCPFQLRCSLPTAHRQLSSDGLGEVEDAQLRSGVHIGLDEPLESIQAYQVVRRVARPLDCRVEGVARVGVLVAVARVEPPCGHVRVSEGLSELVSERVNHRVHPKDALRSAPERGATRVRRRRRGVRDAKCQVSKTCAISCHARVVIASVGVMLGNRVDGCVNATDPLWSASAELKTRLRGRTIEDLQSTL